MADELIHKEVGTEVTEVEYDAIDAHVCNNQATGDMMYASSATQWKRFGKGSTGDLVMESGGLPVWGSAFTSNKTFNDNIEARFGTTPRSRIYSDGTDTIWDLRLNGTGDLMIALAGSFPAPDPTAVHIRAGDAGTVTANGSSRLILEDDVTVYISILTPNTQNAGIFFGDPEANRANGIWADHSAAALYLRVEDSNRLKYTANTFAFQEATTISVSTGNLTLQSAANADILLSDGSTLFYFDGGEEALGIGAAVPASFGVGIYLESSTDSKPEIRIRTTAASNNGAHIEFHHDRGGGSLNDNDAIGEIEYHGFNSAAADTIFGQIHLVALDVTDTTEDSEFHFCSLVAGTEAIRLTVGAGLQIGAPTGGDKGAGTINAAADIYKNNTAYTNPDYVFEHWATGRIVQYMDRPGALDYQGLMPLKDLKRYIHGHYRFPHITDAPAGIFDRADAALVAVEQAHLYLFEHAERMERFEKQFDVIKQAEDIAGKRWEEQERENGELRNELEEVRTELAAVRQLVEAK